MNNPLNDKGCQLLLQAVIYNAFEAVEGPAHFTNRDSGRRSRLGDEAYQRSIDERHRRAMIRLVKRGIEFAERQPNKFIDFYESLYNVDVQFLRERIIRIGNDKLNELEYE